MLFSVTEDVYLNKQQIMCRNILVDNFIVFLSYYSLILL